MMNISSKEVLFSKAENDDRLAELEELLWMQKLPKLYLLKLKHLAEQRLENFENNPAAMQAPAAAPVFSDNRIRRGGKYEGLRRYGRR